MATSSMKTTCLVCNKEKITYLCHGCSGKFCLLHLTEHQKNLALQLEQMENDHDGLRQSLQDQRTDQIHHPLIDQIDQWEKDSIDKIKRIASQCRMKLMKYRNMCLRRMENKLNHLAEQIKEMRYENEFNEIDLNELKQTIRELQDELVRSTANVSIEQLSTSFIRNISVRITKKIDLDIQWKQIGITIAGGNGYGNELNQLCWPMGFCIDDNNQTIYIADCGNARIIEWKINETSGQIVAGGNGQGQHINQLYEPSNAIIDQENNAFIIADGRNRRVMRWSMDNVEQREVIISDIDCCDLTMDKDGSLYVSDWKKNEVKRWRKGEINGTIVAGGNEKGNQLNQLNNPRGIFVDDDDDYALYICDVNNHRVIKWMKDSKEGIIVAGGNGEGDHRRQLSGPSGVIVDPFGQIYVADRSNDRIMRWCEGMQEGIIVVGGNGRGDRTNQLRCPVSLSMDKEGNLYVAEFGNHRIQKFVVD